MAMINQHQDNNYLSGQLLIAMPSMVDPRFEKSVIYICAHNSDGAMGLLVNRPIEDLSFPQLLGQLEIDLSAEISSVRVMFGGPIEQGRGFVLHSPDYLQDASLVVDENVVLTSTVEVLQAIAEGSGPKKYLLALGYAGWDAGQLDSEIKNNGWLSVGSDNDLIFGSDVESKWLNAMTKIGINPDMLSDNAGHA
tara:strand:+ start:249 stop:830 length:582 start_codon:yes stop_codon:yes gene_type:complete